jgi:hypothetical protein
MSSGRAIKRAIWIGLVGAVPLSKGDPRWIERHGDAAGAYARALAYASSEASFRRAIRAALATEGARATEFNDIELLSARPSGDPEAEAFSQLIDALRRTRSPQFGDWHQYPREEFESTADWLKHRSKDASLTDLQRAVLREIGNMLDTFELPLLGEASLETDDDELTINLRRKGASGSDITIRVDGAAEVVVSFGMPHVHYSCSDRGEQEAALNLIAAALLGHVRLDYWEAEGELHKTAVLIESVEGGDWATVAASHWTSEPIGDRPPDRSEIIGMAFTGGENAKL